MPALKSFRGILGFIKYFILFSPDFVKYFLCFSKFSSFFPYPLFYICPERSAENIPHTWAFPQEKLLLPGKSCCIIKM